MIRQERSSDRRRRRKVEKREAKAIAAVEEVLTREQRIYESAARYQLLIEQAKERRLRRGARAFFVGVLKARQEQLQIRMVEGALGMVSHLGLFKRDPRDLDRTFCGMERVQNDSLSVLRAADGGEIYGGREVTYQAIWGTDLPAVHRWCPACRFCAETLYPHLKGADWGSL